MIAVHKDTSIVRGTDGIDRSAVVTGRFRYDALAASDFPAVGDWVALEPTRPEAGPDDLLVIAAVLPRRSAFVRSAADASRRTAGHLADEQVIAANVDVAFIVAGLDHDFNLRRLERYLAVAWSSGVDPVIVLNKADIADDLEGRLVAVAAIAPGVPVVVLSALTGDHLADLGEYLAPRPDRGRARLLGRRQVDPRQRPARRAAPGDGGASATTTRAAGTRRPTASCSSCPAGPCSSTPRASARSRSPAPTRASRPRSTTSPSSPLACRFRDCRHQDEPGCAVRAALDDGSLSADRLASQQKLERELAFAERKGDPRAQAEERKRWKAIHKSVGKHMDMKYGGDGWR